MRVELDVALNANDSLVSHLQATMPNTSFGVIDSIIDGMLQMCTCVRQR